VPPSVLEAAPPWANIGIAQKLELVPLSAPLFQDPYTVLGLLS
jgi:hypothetical protein